MFKWSESSVEDLVEHILSVPAQYTTSTIAYYRRKGCVDIVKKIQYARRLALQQRLLRRAEIIDLQEEE